VKTAPAVQSSKASSGSYLLQIGAYKSEGEAMSAWKTYQSKHATLLSGFGPDVQKADLGEKGTWYRLRIASFADKDAAAALCDRLKAQNANCFLAH
jgi:cell division protein FtsN